MKPKTKTEARKIAIETARSILRDAGESPEDVTAERALVVLDDFVRQYPNRIASIWYMSATDNQIRLFVREWDRWGYNAKVEKIARERMATARR